MRSLFSTLRDVDLTVVAPSSAHVPEWLTNVLVNEGMYRNLVDEIQRFRGYVYVKDKAIPSSSLDEQGRHYSEYDFRAWHIVLRDRRQELCGAIRVGLMPWTRINDISDLQVVQYLARLSAGNDEKATLQTVVRNFLENCRTIQPTVWEPGAWAVSEDMRRSRLAPVLAASIWSLGRAIGGAAGVSTATTRHGSSEILKKMGGFELAFNGAPLPPFYDTYHECFIELVGFDSDYLNPRLETTVTEIQDYIKGLPIITREDSSCAESPERVCSTP